MISQKALSEFKKLWLQEYGTEISDKEALERAVGLLSFFDAIYRPIKKDWLPKKSEAN